MTRLNIVVFGGLALVVDDDLRIAAVELLLSDPRRRRRPTAELALERKRLRDDTRFRWRGAARTTKPGGGRRRGAAHKATQDAATIARGSNR